MGIADDIARIIEQERGLVFSAFDEHTAFAIGLAIRERASREALGLVADVRLWDRPLFYCAMPGTTADNPNWVRRKANTVQRLHKSTYRLVLEAGGEERLFPPHKGLSPDDYVMAGGSFPIAVRGVGVVGAATVSGLHERDDHDVVVAAICGVLGVDAAALALPPRRH
ncbi:heme-degrading domain-containing protein [Devosia sp.]|uniref:heme-degrading domain-containing protein n=1 Tax=Devosia sp. TaxID=1871048 RepID=UPI002EECEABB